MNTHKSKVLTLMGPTASGKTELAIRLHQELAVEIISVDSALVYTGMDIGTAKPTAEELSKAPHRLINIRDPASPYSVADFVVDATSEIEEVLASGKTPLLVGGTMLYFKALLEGLSPMPSASPEIRQQIEALAARDGWPAVHAELVRLDPESAANIHPNHSQRLSRALEVTLASGRPMSAWQSIAGKGLEHAYEWIQMAVVPQDRSVLHQRIQLRFQKMLAEGFVGEVQALYDRGDLHIDLPAIRAVGYRQVWEYLEGSSDFNAMSDKGVIATRQLAKRQLTWLRGWKDLKHIDTLSRTGEQLSIDSILAKALKFIN